MTTIEHAKRIAKARADAHVRRASAWANVPETVLGIPLRPITPASASLLMGIRNAFIAGIPPIEADVKNFILFHSLDFDPLNPSPRFWKRLKIRVRTDKALCPWNTPKARQKGIRATNFLRACQEIRAIVEETWADALPPDSDDGALPPATVLMASLQAQLYHSFAKEYAFWPLPQAIEHTPLRQLFQLLRCADGAYYNSEEIAADFELLRTVNPGAN